MSSGVNDLQKTETTTKNPNIKTVMFNTDIENTNLTLKLTLYLVLNKTFLNNKKVESATIVKEKVLFPLIDAL